MNKPTKEQQADNARYLADMLASATTDDKGRVRIYSALLRVSRDGTSRCIVPFIVQRDTGAVLKLAYQYSVARGRWPAEVNSTRCVRISGCGMDMGYNLAGHIAYTGGLLDTKNDQGESREVFVHTWL